jgi:hypothetical protein
MIRASKKRFLYVAGLFLAVSLSAGWLYSRNALFRFSDIEVRTDDAELTQQIRGVLLRYLGRSLFSLSLHEIENKILELPKVEKVTLHRLWPSKLLVTLQPKVAVGMSFLGSKLWTLDKSGRAIEVVRTPVALPLLKNFFQAPSFGLKMNEREGAEFFAWLDSVEHQQSRFIDFDKIHEIEWSADRGIILRSADLELEVEIGNHNFDAAWHRVNTAYGFASAQGLNPDFLDATYRSRVVMRSASKLQNSQSGLNLKGLVRRNGGRALPL